MPIYEYRCPNGHVFEIFQKMAEEPAKVCVECGAGPVEKLLYPVAVHFKGSGFYSTDYGKGSRKPTSSDGDSGSTSGGDSSSSSGEGVSKATPAEKKPKPAASSAD